MNNYVPCPKCGGAAEKLNFTWWGGLLGPKILTHVKCSACNYKYNGKTGKDNTTGIVIYSAVIFVLIFGLLFVMVAAMAVLSVATR